MVIWGSWGCVGEARNLWGAFSSRGIILCMYRESQGILGPRGVPGDLIICSIICVGGTRQSWPSWGSRRIRSQWCRWRSWDEWDERNERREWFTWNARYVANEEGYLWMHQDKEKCILHTPKLGFNVLYCMSEQNYDSADHLEA